MNEEEHIPAASRPEVTSPENPTVPQTTVEGTSPGRETPEAPEEDGADQVSATPPTPAAETAPPPATEVRAPATPPTTAEPDPAAATVTQSTTPPPTSVQETEHPTVPDRPDPRMRKPALYKPRMDPGQTRFRPRQSMSDISLADIHYKNVDVLTRFIDGQGRILPRRKTRISAKMQRRVKTAIKQARHLAMLPYTPTHIRSARRR